MLIINCGDSGGESEDITPPEFLQNPRIVLNPNLTTPLAALLTVETDEPTRVIARVERVGGGGETKDLSLHPISHYSLSHFQPRPLRLP